MKKLFLFAAATMIGLTASGQTTKNLRFNAQGKFKILQLTDLHMIQGDKRSDVVFENFRSTITAEKPDLIIITGDLIYSGPGVEKVAVVFDSISQYGVPFTVTFGNHDRQLGNTNAELWEVAKRYKNFVGQSANGVDGVGNFDLPIMSADGKTPKFALYLLDSHEDSDLKPIVPGYNYIKRSQIDWYIARSTKHQKTNGGKLMPSIAFFHIPLPEFTEALAAKRDTIYGVANEKPCPPMLNSGMFTAMRERGDVRAIIVGHDHDNDFATAHYGILLAYGRFSGGKTEYFNLDQPGARVIELTEGDEKFDTWIRLLDRSMNQHITF